ncbi:aldehyde dehydrogenase, dimeric NADP-preferring-like [Cylas formicarius]|uniref:aldehyde dehydrogenase, dimeric NADP-preferring-like n=1 Tax=Cylas formicarius TaxID=197179 RepID=UPI0029586992|nr:aldehyde dehydrogenase, dimeric NADP-preferring-like [Cylas formicarius]XP_060521630.1 aldehyde dehydrogenase, dimeric NADP-preferring-like [Cylas formicarius]
MDGEYILPRVKLAYNGIEKDNNIAIVDIETMPEKSRPTDIVKETRNIYDTGKTKPYTFRKKQLQNLLRFMMVEEKALLKALHDDLRKPEAESYLFEIEAIKSEIKVAIKNLKKWMKPEEPRKPLMHFFDQVKIYNDPLGVVLVMGAWNYPVLLTLNPAIGAIAAGNCVILKPSDLAPNVAELFSSTLNRYLDSECYPVFLGGIPETTDLLKERFDYIFFTGSPQVGKIVHKAAANHLTPCTLELGGKSPTYIDKTADIDMAAKRTLWGKLCNSGQTCIAPDYILCDKEVQDKFVECAAKHVKKFFGANVKYTGDYARMISERHFVRVANFLKNQKIALGGHVDAQDLFIHPTVLTDVKPDDEIMQEEIFGPLLPIIPVRDAIEAVNFINRREKPLALYIFTKDKEVQRMFLENTSSGGVTINDTLMHVNVETLPFGGVGNSGMGSYHCKKSFDTFTHKKSVLIKNFSGLLESAQSVRYPPYSDKNIRLARFANNTLNKTINMDWLPYLAMFVLGIVLTVIAYYLKKSYDGEL